MATAKKEKASALPTAPKPLKAKADAPLHELIVKKVGTYESQADAARDMDIGKTYLSRLMTGVKANPSDEILAKMGIARQVRYSFIVTPLDA